MVRRTARLPVRLGSAQPGSKSHFGAGKGGKRRILLKRQRRERGSLGPGR
jgi:hypothetical protein